MSRTSPRLGRGLSALIPPREYQQAVTAVAAGTPGGGLRQIPIDTIRPNPHQPRRAFDARGIEKLAESIRSGGVLQPVLVRPLPDGQFELVAGERRWRAAKAAGLEHIPAMLRSVSDAESLELALIENLQREDLNPLERAAAYERYIEAFKISHEEMAQRLGESRANISNYLRLRRLEQRVQELIASGQLGMGQARAIAGIEDPRRQLAVARMAVGRNLAVRQVESLAKTEGHRQEKASPEPSTRVGHMVDVERALGSALGLKVKLLPGKKKNSGRVVIYYADLEEFDRVAQALGGRAALE